LGQQAVEATPEFVWRFLYWGSSTLTPVNTIQGKPMRKTALLLVLVLAVSASYSLAQSQDEMEIEQLILDSNAELRASLASPADDYSMHGALEFWSSGGLLEEIPPGGRHTEFEEFNVVPKHIRVLSLVEGQAAVAHFYSEGSMKPKGAPRVAHYFTRVTQVYVKEDGAWKLRSSHWSPVVGGGGTSQTALQE
jgi:hypothetical protein